jgi:hypothetical protein
MDPLQHLISAAHLNAILERAGVLTGRYVQDVTIMNDRSMGMSRIVRLRLTYDGPAATLPGSLIQREIPRLCLSLLDACLNLDSKSHNPRR